MQTPKCVYASHLALDNLLEAFPMTLRSKHGRCFKDAV